MYVIRRKTHYYIGCRRQETNGLWRIGVPGQISSQPLHRHIGHTAAPERMQYPVNTDRFPEPGPGLPKRNGHHHRRDAHRLFSVPHGGASLWTRFKALPRLLSCEGTRVSIQGVELVRLPPCSLTAAAFASNGAAGLFVGNPSGLPAPSPQQLAKTRE